MAYTVNDSLEIPWGIGLYPIANATSATRAVTDTEATSPAPVTSSSDYTIGWHVSNNMLEYQVQWRWMRRLSPAAALLIDPSGSELWYGWNGADLSSGTQGNLGEWGAWQGNNLASEVSTPSRPRTGAIKASQTRYMWDTGQTPPCAVSISIPYDTSTYDAARLQIRVREFTFPNDATKPVSDWGSAEVFIGFIPTTSTSAERNEDGSVTVAVNTNLTRANNLVQFPAFYDSNGLLLGGGISETVGDDFTIIIPAEYAPESTLYFGGSTLTSSDGIGSDPWAVELGGTIHSLAITTVTPVTPITEPTVTVDVDGNVTVTDSSYDSVLVRCSYVDEEGNSYSEIVEMTYNGTKWVGTISTPPLDVTVNVTTVCIVGDDWDSWTKTAKVDSGGLVMFDWDDDHFAIRYNPDRQLTVDLSAKAVSVSSIALPKSRHGMQRTSSMTMTGTLINPAEDAYNGDGWLAQLEILNKPHDWYFRTPNGLRRRVMVTDYTPAWATQSANRVMQVTINMEEVGD